MADDVRILLADDHPAARAGVRAVLEDSGFSICAEVADASSAVEVALRERPDVCLLDVRMPGGGIAAAHEISTRLPETAVVMLTVSRDDEDLFDALRAGAAGYLIKDIDPARLPLALHGVLRGEAALPPTLVARLVEEFRHRGRRRGLPLVRKRGVDLTSREWEVLDLLEEGLSTREIATRLSISDVTARRHISAILKKLDVPDRKAAIRLLKEQSER